MIQKIASMIKSLKRSLLDKNEPIKNTRKKGSQLKRTKFQVLLLHLLHLLLDLLLKALLTQIQIQNLLQRHQAQNLHKVQRMKSLKKKIKCLKKRQVLLQILCKKKWNHLSQSSSWVIANLILTNFNICIRIKLKNDKLISQKMSKRRNKIRLKIQLAKIFLSMTKWVFNCTICGTSMCCWVLQTLCKLFHQIV